MKWYMTYHQRVESELIRPDASWIILRISCPPRRRAWQSQSGKRCVPGHDTSKLRPTKQRDSADPCAIQRTFVSWGMVQSWARRWMELGLWQSIQWCQFCLWWAAVEKESTIQDIVSPCFALALKEEHTVCYAHLDVVVAPGPSQYMKEAMTRRLDPNNNSK